MSSLRVSFAQWPDGLQPGDSDWETIVRLVQQERPDILVTNELPFGEWLACSNVYDPEQAQRSVDLHEEGIEALHGLRVPTIISTRPILSGDRLSNEAFALVQGEYLFLHQKHYFPEEPGFYESTWFTTGQQGFQVVEVNGVKVGALLCTELMFNEHARQYGRAGAELIVAPRAADADHHYWEVAASMAAVVSGAYVITANRTGQGAGGQVFGGRGMLFSPQAKELSTRAAGDDLRLIQTYEIDIAATALAKASYPCYVPEYEWQ